MSYIRFDLPAIGRGLFGWRELPWVCDPDELEGGQGDAEGGDHDLLCLFMGDLNKSVPIPPYSLVDRMYAHPGITKFWFKSTAAHCLGQARAAASLLRKAGFEVTEAVVEECPGKMVFEDTVQIAVDPIEETAL